ncbi:MAG: AMIN domain-containing protein [Gemmatimonadota bacterium]|nr:MAG: AMIN domain-containing protein [Gemmatimonadota bacterium]
MKRSLILAALGLFLAAPQAVAASRDVAEPGEVTAVSVLPGAGQTHVVIDVRGSVSVQDFMLENPARLVIDVEGAQLNAPGSLYDGRNRGGILDIRYSQFRPDVVRVVLELESVRGYRLTKVDENIHVSFGSDRSFQAWSSATAANWADVAGDPSPGSTKTTFKPSRPVPSPQSQQPPVTVTYDSAHIRDVASGFAEYSGKSIVVGRDVDAIVNATIKNQPWDVAFQTILEANGLTGTEDVPGIIRVDSRESLAARDSTEPLVTKVISINYAKAATLATVMESVISERGSVVADTATNKLLITDVQSRIEDDSILVSQLDIRTPQVSIQAKLIFVDRTDIEELGIQYDLGTTDQFFNSLVQRPDPASAEAIDTDGDGVPDAIRATEFYDEDVTIVDLGGNALSGVANADAFIASPALELIFSTAIGAFNLTTFVRALQQVQLADLQAEPLTSVADNTKAYILVGERTPIRVVDVSTQVTAGGQAPRATTEIVPTGLQLEVTPHVTHNRQVLMEVKVENSSIQEAPADLGFTFQTQVVESQILVPDGDTYVIGGLTVSGITVSKSGIPFLVDLPILGGLFGFTERRETRRDLLILVTPHILDDEATGSGR